MSDHDDRRIGPEDAAEGHSLGVAGGMAKAFIHSPLSPLLLLLFLCIGIIGLIGTPRQEDPEISVPMVDIFFQYPGASSEDVAKLAVDPLQRMMAEMPGVKHVYGAAARAEGMVTVRFEVGEPLGPSIVKVRQKIDSNLDKVPPGVQNPLVKEKTIDHVPVVTLTLWSQPGELEDDQLRTLALDVLQDLNQVPNSAESFVVGGRRQEIRVEVLPERLGGFGISMDQVAQTIQTANAEQTAGTSETGGSSYSVTSGAFLRDADDIKRLVLAVRQGVPVYVSDVARVSAAPQEAQNIVHYYTGPAHDPEHDGEAVRSGMDQRAPPAPAVTIAVAKKEGSNGVVVANAILDELETLRGSLIPANVNVAVTRNYGETADDKVTSLIKKLFIATGIVSLLVWVMLGWRPMVVVTIVIPVVILVTVFGAMMMEYSVNRVSLFALIFAIGILVDDAIVVVENIYRRWLEKGASDTDTAVDAVAEVGNPTIIATFTVVAALLPMGFVSGMMGPYMEPIPALGSVAMVISLFAAFMFTPWLVMRIKPSLDALRKAEEREHKEKEFVGRYYRRLMVPIIQNRTLGWVTLFSIVAVFFLSVSLFYFKVVAVKMLPYDNKSEFDVVIDMPEGTALFETANVAHKMAEAMVAADAEHRLHPAESCGDGMSVIKNMQSYVGTASPFNFNGLVRHYYLREEPWQADIAVVLADKHDRHCASHDIAMVVRDILTPIAQRFGAVLTVAEVPPGPPVLQSVVAEIYGPDAETRRQVARDLTEIFRRAQDEDSQVVDVDNYMTAPHEIRRFVVDTEKAVRRGISVDAINRNLAMAMGGTKLGDVKHGRKLEPTYITLQVPLATRSQLTRLRDLPIQAPDGGYVPLAELGRFEEIPEDPVIYYKDLRPIEYVVGDVVGRLGAPIYGMFLIGDLLKEYQPPQVKPEDQGLGVKSFWTGPPDTDKVPGFEWTGEWTVTYETFRDMGIAFMAALVLIYILVVAEFNNFVLPLVIMAPIPLTLVGIVPGHSLMGAEFTATSMIGFIALAGIIVRNSILLVDFAQQLILKGMEVQEAVVVAAETRMRPIVITALALVGGSFVIIFDPIFQGMAVSLLFGVLVATLLTLVVIPLGCISAAGSFRKPSSTPSPAVPHERGHARPAGGQAPQQGPMPPAAVPEPRPLAQEAAGEHAAAPQGAAVRPLRPAAPRGRGVAEPAAAEGAASSVVSHPAGTRAAPRPLRPGLDVRPRTGPRPHAPRVAEEGATPSTGSAEAPPAEGQGAGRTGAPPEPSASVERPKAPSQPKAATSTVPEGAGQQAVEGSAAPRPAPSDRPAPRTAPEQPQASAEPARAEPASRPSSAEGVDEGIEAGTPEAVDPVVEEAQRPVSRARPQAPDEDDEEAEAASGNPDGLALPPNKGRGRERTGQRRRGIRVKSPSGRR